MKDFSGFLLTDEVYEYREVYLELRNAQYTKISKKRKKELLKKKKDLQNEIRFLEQNIID